MSSRTISVVGNNNKSNLLYLSENCHILSSYAAIQNTIGNIIENSETITNTDFGEVYKIQSYLWGTKIHEDVYFDNNFRSTVCMWPYIGQPASKDAYNMIINYNNGFISDNPCNEGLNLNALSPVFDSYRYGTQSNIDPLNVNNASYTAYTTSQWLENTPVINQAGNNISQNDLALLANIFYVNNLDNESMQTWSNVLLYLIEKGILIKNPLEYKNKISIYQSGRNILFKSFDGVQIKQLKLLFNSSFNPIDQTISNPEQENLYDINNDLNLSSEYITHNGNNVVINITNNQFLPNLDGNTKEYKVLYRLPAGIQLVNVENVLDKDGNNITNHINRENLNSYSTTLQITDNIFNNEVLNTPYFAKYDNNSWLIQTVTENASASGYIVNQKLYLDPENKVENGLITNLADFCNCTLYSDVSYDVIEYEDFTRRLVYRNNVDQLQYNTINSNLPIYYLGTTIFGEVKNNEIFDFAKNTLAKVGLKRNQFNMENNMNTSSNVVCELESTSVNTTLNYKLYNSFNLMFDNL